MHIHARTYCMYLCVCFAQSTYAAFSYPTLAGTCFKLAGTKIDFHTMDGPLRPQLCT